MSISIDAQLVVHKELMRMLPVRTHVCADHREDPDGTEMEAQNVPKPPIKRGGQRARPLRPAGYVSPIQRAEIGERRMLAEMSAGKWYSAKHLAALGGMDEKTFYTHVRRMVDRKQLVRSGSRHHFRYRKASL